MAPVKSEAEWKEEDEAAGLVEFKRVLKNWARHRVEWARIFPDVDLGKLNIIEDLMKLDISLVYLDIIKTDTDRKSFGYMPLLASCSEGEIGAVNAECFAERIVSASNLVMDHKNTKTNGDVFEMPVVLRMNRECMPFMRKHFFRK